MTVLLIALGAAIGAPARYLTERAVQSRHRTAFPWGTLVVNVLASLALGVLAGARLDPRLGALLGTGFCGALSTYSAFSYETLQLSATGARWQAVLNVLLTLLAGIGAAALGWTLGQAS